MKEITPKIGFCHSPNKHRSFQRSMFHVSQLGKTDSPVVQIIVNLATVYSSLKQNVKNTKHTTVTKV